MNKIPVTREWKHKGETLLRRDGSVNIPNLNTIMAKPCRPPRSKKYHGHGKHR